jgi:hypothetical protein
MGAERTTRRDVGGWVVLWSVLAAASLGAHVAIEMAIRGHVNWTLVLGNVLTLPTVIVLAGAFGRAKRRSAEA